MSISASIDVKLASQKSNVESVIIIKKLIDFGWSYCNSGKIMYLPLGDNDDYDWRIIDEIDEVDLFNVLDQKRNMGETIGIMMTWKNTGVGGDFLFWTDGSISINLTINRKTIESNGIEITDINWYLQKILPCFAKDYIIELYTYEEHV